jgi:hypothetical protein
LLNPYVVVANVSQRVRSMVEEFDLSILDDSLINVREHYYTTTPAMGKMSITKPTLL